MARILNTVKSSSTFKSGVVATAVSQNVWLAQWIKSLRLTFEGGKLAFVVAQASTAQNPPEHSNPCLVWLAGYLDGNPMPFDPALFALGGIDTTSFQFAVWQAVSEIPFGETCSYGEIARLVGRPRAARAVGTAVGANPCVLFRPCHRVISSAGTLGGFAFELKLKQALLAHEGVSLQY